MRDAHAAAKVRSFDGRCPGACASNGINGGAIVGELRRGPKALLNDNQSIRSELNRLREMAE
jgi:hypothetical protein